MDSRIWSLRNKQEDIARAAQAGNVTWAAMAAYEIAIRASHAQAVWQEFLRAHEIQGEHQLGQLLEEVSVGAEQIIQARKASDQDALKSAASAMEELVTRIELAWQSLSG